MKKLFIAAAVAATLITPQAFAQAKNFEGFGISGGINFANNTTEVTSTIFNAKASETSQNLDLNATYNAAIGQQFVLGLGVSVGLGEQKAGTLVDGATTVTAKVKTMNSFFIAPGYALSDTFMVYGKLAALSGTVEASNVTDSVTGIGYGAGVRGAIDKNLYWTAEYVYNKLNDVSKATNNQVNKGLGSSFIIGVGYKF